MELELRFKALGKVKEGATWKFQVGVFETLSADYPKNVALQFWSDKNIALLEALEVDEVYTAYCNPESKENNGTWYTNISCWKVERKDMQAPTSVNEEPSKKTITQKASNTPTSNRVNPPTTPTDYTEEENPDLPY